MFTNSFMEFCCFGKVISNVYEFFSRECSLMYSIIRVFSFYDGLL